MVVSSTPHLILQNFLPLIYLLSLIHFSLNAENVETGFLIKDVDRLTIILQFVIFLLFLLKKASAQVLTGSFQSRSLLIKHQEYQRLALELASILGNPLSSFVHCSFIETNVISFECF